MNPETKPRRLRIVSGPVEKVEAELNILLDSYAALVWNLNFAGDHWEAAVVLLASAEIRKSQLAMMPQMGRPH